MVKAIIFDFDGTLVDTLVDLKDATNLALKEKGYNKEYSYEEAKKLVGMGIRTLCSRALSFKEYTEEEVSSLYDTFIRIYQKIQINNTKPFDKVIPTLDKLKEMGIKLCILSNKVDENTKKITNKLFKENTFDYIMGKKEGFPLKPDPTSLFYILRQINVSKEDILYCGDSDTDMQIAKNANVKAIAVTYGYRDEKVLDSYHPDYKISSFDQILNIVK